MLLAASLSAALLFVAPPQASKVASKVSLPDEPSEAAAAIESRSLGGTWGSDPVPLLGGYGGSDAGPPEEESPWTPLPRTTTTVNVYVGPSSNHNVIGLLPDGARIEVLGRNETGAWIAIALGPGSKLTGWVEASAVTGIADVKGLQLAPTTPIGTPLPSQPTRPPVRPR